MTRIIKFICIVLFISSILCLEVSGFDAPKAKSKKADKVASKETTGQPESVSSSTSAATATAASSSIEGLTFNVEHSFSGDADKQTWSSRGKARLFPARNLRAGGIAELDSYTLSSDERSLFENLLITRSEYRIRISLPNQESNSVTTSIPACMLAGGKFLESWLFFLDSSGQLASVDYTVDPNVFDLAATTCASTITAKTVHVHLPGGSGSSSSGKDTSVRLQSSARIASAVQSERPMAEVIDPVKMMPQQEQSFIRKYWYIILPVAILLFCK